MKRVTKRLISHSFLILYYTERTVVIEEDSVRFAHSGPSHCHLRHRYAITCCQRAPPATRVRGWTRLINHYYPPSFNMCIKYSYSSDIVRVQRRR